MPRTESITIFNATNIALNASTNSAMVSLRKFGPNTRFWGDFTASGPGKVDVNYKIGNSPTDTFHKPSVASLCLGSFLGGAGNASRDRFPLSIMGAEWIKFMAKECNASHVVFSMNLIVSEE